MRCARVSEGRRRDRAGPQTVLVTRSGGAVCRGWCLGGNGSGWVVSLARSRCDVGVESSAVGTPRAKQVVWRRHGASGHSFDLRRSARFSLRDGRRLLWRCRANARRRGDMGLARRRDVCRVHAARSATRSRHPRPALPDSIVFRHALAIDATGNTLAAGSTTGHLWTTDNGGDDWQQLPVHLPPIYAARFA